MQSLLDGCNKLEMNARIQSIIILSLGILVPATSFVSSIGNNHLEDRVSSHLSFSKESTEEAWNRRSFLVSGTAFCTSILSSASNAAASDVRAPLELLLPATRVKLYIDEAVGLCQSIIASEDSSQVSKLALLKDLLDNEPSFITENERKLSKRYLEIKTTDAWQNARRKERELRGAEMGIDYTTPYDKFNTAVQQIGEKSQFQILRSRQRKLEQSSTIRTALNSYTNNLVFGDTYKLNAQGGEKKSLVRNNALPNVNAVVVSDLDLRDLYRNQVLSNMDDARAEIEYQLRTSDINVEDILTYLRLAQSSCQDWFNFIPKSDVEEALKSVMEERKKQIHT